MIVCFGAAPVYAWGWGGNQNNGAGGLKYENEEQGTLPANGRVGDEENISPLLKQGEDQKTAVFSKYAYLLGGILLLLGLGFFLQYRKRMKNSYS